MLGVGVSVNRFPAMFPGAGVDIPGGGGGALPTAGEFTLFDGYTGLSDNSDSSYLKLGTLFTASRTGQVTGVRFYRPAAANDTVRVYLYANDGTKVRDELFAGGTGWVEHTFETPYDYTPAAGALMVAFSTSNGFYGAESNFFNASAYTKGVLTLPQNTPFNSVTGYNGSFATTDTIPNQTFNAGFYGVVPIFSYDFPTALNTGVSNEGALSTASGTVTISTSSTTYENMELTGNIIVQAAAQNVTIRNCRIIADTPFHAIQVQDGAAGFVMEDVEIVGNGTTTNGFLGYGTLRRVHAHGFENGLNIWGGTVLDCYVHDMQGTDGVSHYDSIEVNGANGLDIIHNTLINEKTDTGAIQTNDDLGDLVNVSVLYNLATGGGYTLYCRNNTANTISGIKFVGNKLGEGFYGYYSIDVTLDLWAKNVDAYTGDPIAGP